MLHCDKLLCGSTGVSFSGCSPIDWLELVSRFLVVLFSECDDMKIALE